MKHLQTIIHFFSLAPLASMPHVPCKSISFYSAFDTFYIVSKWPIPEKASFPSRFWWFPERHAVPEPHAFRPFWAHSRKCIILSRFDGSPIPVDFFAALCHLLKTGNYY